MGYRSKSIKTAPGTQLLPPDTTISPVDRWRNAVFDVLALPVVMAMPKLSPDIVEGPLPLHYGFKRWDWRTERALEIALAKRALGRYDAADVLEVGNVLGFAGTHGHTVVDKYEAGAGVVNEDIMTYDPRRRFRLVLCISTLEHIGWDEDPREPEKAAAALDVMSALGDDLLITIPVGYHRQLERSFVDGPFDSVALAVKASRRARWERRPLTDVAKVRYGTPYAYGNGILIGTRTSARSS